MMTAPGPVRVLRGADLLDLSFAYPGLKVERGLLGGRRLVAADPAQPAFLIVTCGPQHVAEQVFPAGGPAADRGLPVGSLIGGGSVLVFEVGANDSIDYSVAGLLDAMGRLPLHVVDAAREPAAASGARPPALAGGTAAAASVAGLVRLLRSTAEFAVRFGTDAVAAPARAAGLLAQPGDVPTITPATLPEPQNPLADLDHPYTGIELPCRLLLSPSQHAGWIHRGEAADPAAGARVELWHTRLSGPTVRAVWNRDRDQEPPEPFGTALDAENRRLLVELTADYTQSTGSGPYLPQPVEVSNLMLSALGGWLDGHGQWPVRPAGVQLSDWRHQATLGRDHYVRLTSEGYLAPFGHPAQRIELIERKFDEDARPAYLFRRLFVVVRKPVMSYDLATTLPADSSPNPPLANLLFPFVSVRIETLVTPDLKVPDQLDHFFPATANEDPFLFTVTAADRDGRICQFRTPLYFLTAGFNSVPKLADVILPEYRRHGAISNGQPPPDDLLKCVRADLRGQAVGFAQSIRPDDTRVDAEQLVWDMAAPPALASAPAGPGDPGPALFVPQVQWARVSVPAASHLSGAAAVVPVRFPGSYARSGFPSGQPAAAASPHPNAGEVFLELIDRAGAESLDMNFSGNSDRSGGLVAPSFSVAGLSRKTGPIAGSRTGDDPLKTFAEGSFDPAEFFAALDAKLLGLVPLTAVIKKAGLDTPLKVPNFFTETVNAVTGFLTDLHRIHDQLSSAIESYPPAGQQVVDTGQALIGAIGAFLAGQLTGHAATAPAEVSPDTTLADVDTAFSSFAAALTNLVSSLPAGTDPGVAALLSRLQQQVATWNNAAGQVLSLRDALQQAARGAQLPETVNGRLEWNPEIQQWPPDVPPNQVVFQPGSLSVIVDLHGSLRPDVASGADVTCTLAGITLALVGTTAPFPAMKLRFDRIRFTMRAGRKPDVDIAFGGVEFIGPLTFINTLRQLIPAGGFSDPPGIQVTSSGIVANYGLPLPNLAIGVFSLENLRLDAYANLPFVDRSMEIGFAFCRRQAPFRLTVSMLGGGGFFGIVVTPQKVAVLEAALEFGADLSMDFGVASGSLSVMAGIYYRLEVDSGSRLTGYFRARGEVDVLGIVSASVELYLELSYDTVGNTVYGRARITLSIHIGFWSQSVTLECEKRFAGSGSIPDQAIRAADAAPVITPPTFAQMMAPYPDPVTGAERDPVDEYCTAFVESS